MIDYRLIRGGSWFSRPSYFSSAFRSNRHFDIDYDNVGFRVCCSSEGNDHAIQLEEQIDG